MEEHMEEMGTRLKEMGGQIAALNKQTKRVQAVTDKLGTIEEDTAGMVGAKVNKVRDAAQSAFEILQHAIERGSVKTTGNTGNIEDYDYGIMDKDYVPMTPAIIPAKQQKSYANTARSTPPISYQRIIEQNTRKNKHIIIDAKGPDLEMLTEEQLVAKANMAVEMVGGEDEGKPGDVCFVSVKRLQNRGMEFELNSTAAAAWATRDAIKKKIISNFGYKAEIKDKGFTVLIVNAPLYFHPEEEED
ncbi:hypothetical protein PUNSTDRAFT_137649 [Punctularia strigosozonata HHB-11173 SS5]|uniref:uncharacterized protein n=1 Tax=Punctularia strigosozonata (strain HHB-11173) TaxID=741275 RepID=UPI00044171A1|nr:uncharacterized protein PUNSTDRAFT_137649 [Punctularia strigosozonata HHB-11173 SS5]EIN05542.1 hypothetical protein PUNSTDRAFT_137649 [Punctularia strigosozonata HHB-11173 SS5]